MVLIPLFESYASVFALFFYLLVFYVCCGLCIFGLHSISSKKISQLIGGVCVHPSRPKEKVS